MGVFSVKTAKGGEGIDFDVPPAGSHAAVLVAIIDLGTQEQEYQGKKSSKRMVQLVWELADEKHPKQNRNFTVGRDYGLSLNSKAGLRKLIEGWFAKELPEDQFFEIEKLLGSSGILTVIHKTSGAGNTYAKVEGMKPLVKGMPKPKPTLPLTVWSIGCGKPIPELEWIPWIVGKPIKEVIGRSPEYQGKPVPGAKADNGAAPAADEQGGGGDADEESQIPF
jgi:hypothetical protein